jgi:hypothetical protein
MRYNPLSSLTQMKATPLRTGLGWIYSILFVSSLMLPLAPDARAQEVSSTYFGFFQGGSGVNAGQPSSNVQSGTSSSIGTTYTYPGLSGTVAASVTPGDSFSAPGYFEAIPDLHASATATNSLNNMVGFTDSTSASFSDELHFTTPYLLPSTSLDFTFDFSVDGSISGGGSGTLQVNWGNGSGSAFSLTGSAIEKVVIDVTYLTVNRTGPEFDFNGPITETLTAGVQTNNPASGSADFGDTVKLEEVQVTDANGNPVAGDFYDTNSDGTLGSINFLSNTVLTPEPSTLSLIASALLPLAFWGARRARCWRQSL